MKHIKLYEEFKDDLGVYRGIRTGDTVKLPIWGEVVVNKISNWGTETNPKINFSVTTKNNEEKDISDRIFKNAEIIKSPAAEEEKRKRTEKETKRTESKERAKGRITKAKYIKLIKSWVESIKADQGEKAGDILPDTIENFILGEPEVVKYIEKLIAREGREETPIERIQWDMEAEL